MAISPIRRPSRNFYSRPCGRGDITLIPGASRHCPFLLTPLREGRLKVKRDRFLMLNISTHAPAGGATQHAANFFAVVLISTHAPAGGATVWRYACRNNLQHFYSRPCGRGDAIRAIPTHSCRDISTHAPAGGATLIASSNPIWLLFLLTPLREGRPKPLAIAMLVPLFLLTPLREGRQQFSTSPS